MLILLVTSLSMDALLNGVSGFQNRRLSLGPCYLDVSDPCSSGGIAFYLLGRKDPETPVRISVNDTALPVEFDIGAETKVLIHGYAGNFNTTDMFVLREAYGRVGSKNVIVVDWGDLVKLPCYPLAALNTLQAGKCTAVLLANIAELSNRKVSDFHAIGFSLGAHVAAFASNELEKSRGIRLRRITGLDPALPFFASLDATWKLDRDDADFVDVIHTNSGVFGKIEATGHADFYVNQGFSQPACKKSQNVPLCSHLMAPVYFGESVIAKDGAGFWGSSCSSLVQHLIGECVGKNGNSSLALMGEHCDRRTRGIYFVTTRERPPFALGPQSETETLKNRF